MNGFEEIVHTPKKTVAVNKIAPKNSTMNRLQ